MTRPLARITQFIVDLPLRPAIAIALVIGLVLPASIVAWRELSLRRERLFETLAADHVRIVETLANGMRTPIWDVRPETGQPLIDVILADSRVTTVSVTAPVLTEPLVAGGRPSQGAEVLALERPVLHEGQPIGLVRVEMSAASIEAEAVRQGWQALLTALFQIACGLLLIFPLIRLKVLSPVSRLVDQSRQLAEGKLDRTFEWTRGDELGALGRSFENTRRSLETLFDDVAQHNAMLRQRETELSRQTQALRATLDNMTDGITLIDGSHRLLAWNDRFIGIFRLPADAVHVGRPVADLHPIWARSAGFSSAQAEAVVGQIRAGLDRRQAYSTQIETPAGQIILLRRQPLAEGGFVTTYTDVSEQVKAQRQAEESLRLLDAVIDAVPAILHVKDRQLRYEYVNRYFLDLFGLKRDQVLGRTLEDVMDPQWLPEFEDGGPKVIAAGKALPFYEIAVRRPGGDRLDLFGTKVPLLDEEGAVAHVVTVEIDITDRKRIQRALSESEELYRLLVDLSPYGILLIGADGILFINKAGCALLGAASADDVVGQNYVDFVADSEKEAGSRRLMRILEGGESLGQAERRFVRLDGEEILVATSGVPFMRGNERLALVMCVDITEMKRAEKEIARQREALHQAEKMTAFGSLLAGVAHELNNPLSVVVGRASMLAESDLEPRVAAAVDKIRAAAERCAGIVKTFLAMARQQAPERVFVHVGALIDQSLDLLAYSFTSSGIRVVKSVAGDIPGTMADADQLAQVINNLLINAKQALDGWSGPREITIAAAFEREARRIAISVSDSGPGIPDGLLGRVFDPFFTTKSVGFGTGIGLAVCRGIIESHGGTIEVANAAAGGAHFVVKLPVTDRPPAVTDAAPGEVDRAAPAHRILVIDDEEEIREILRDILASPGAVIEEAANGQDALDRLKEAPFDLVISDLLMPVLDGPGFYAEMCRAYPDLLDRLMFITGDTLSPSARDFLRRAGRPVIEKPFVPDEVRKAARALLGT